MIVIISVVVRTASSKSVTVDCFDEEEIICSSPADAKIKRNESQGDGSPPPKYGLACNDTDLMYTTPTDSTCVTEPRGLERRGSGDFFSAGVISHCHL
uniref:Secreted protein n=1 Tax=Romanomermis culicivorax TaxID=13658 RepID=A0A915KJE2_ROMCU